MAHPTVVPACSDMARTKVYNTTNGDPKLVLLIPNSIFGPVQRLVFL